MAMTSPVVTERHAGESPQDSKSMKGNGSKIAMTSPVQTTMSGDK